MRLSLFLIAFFGLALVAGISPVRAQMILNSEDVKEQEMLPDNLIYSGFGCMGGNMSPQLSWGGIPSEAKSLAITMYDPDAPTGSGWWHWVVFNIPVTVKSLQLGASLNAMPEGSVEAITDFGTYGYGGACPPEGDKAHRYIFTLYALDVETLSDVDEKSSGAKVGYFLNKHTLEKASITGIYSREAVK